MKQDFLSIPSRCNLSQKPDQLRHSVRPPQLKHLQRSHWMAVAQAIMSAAVFVFVVTLANLAYAQNACQSTAGTRNNYTLSQTEVHYCTCSTASTESGSVWGGGQQTKPIYTNDSSICRAAKHAGAWRVDGDVVGLRYFNSTGINFFPGSDQNGVNTTSYNGTWNDTFEFVPTAGPASQLAVAQQPAGQSGQQLSAQPVVHIKDAQGNLVAYDNSTQVQVSISGGGTLGGTVTKQASGGIVTFTDLTVTGSTSATHTLTFENASAGSISSVTSNVTLTAGPASQLDVAQQPAGQSGQQLSAQPVVHIKDAQGNLVTSDSSTQVKVSISGGGTLGGTVTKQASGGVVTFTDLTVTGSTSATHTLTFENASAGSISSVTSNVTLTAGPASQLDVAQQPAGQSGQQLSAQPVVHIKDAQGNLVTSDSSTQVKVSISGGGTLGGTVTKQASGGVVTFTDLTVTGSTSATHTLTFENASAGSISSVTSNVTLTAGPASQLDVAQQPAGQSGQQLSAQPVVHIKDAQGNLVTSDSSTQVKVSISGGGTLGGTVTKQASGGVVTFTDLTVTGSTSATHTLTFENASAGSISSVTSNVTLTAGSASQLAVATPPAGGQSGAALSAQPVVHIKDAQGNLVTSDNSTQVQVAVFGTGGTLGGTLKKQASGGVVTFDNLTLAGQVGTDYTLNFANASAGLIFPVTYGPVTVTAGPASQLDVAQQPAGQSGQQLSAQPVVHIKDAQGNLVTSDSSTQVKVSISGGGTLGGTVTKQASGGVVTFTDLTVTGSTSATHTLTFENASAGSISSVTSDPVTLTAGPASQLDVAQQPAGQSGQQLSAQPVVHIKDAQGNLVTSDNSTQVQVSISGGGTLGGTVTKQASGGIVTFTDLTVTGSTSATHTLTFENASAGSISSVTSNVTLTAGPASQFAVAQQPAGQSGQQLSAQPVVHIKDAQGNLVTSDNSTQVQVSISPGGTLGGTVTKQASGGVVTFTDLTVTGSTSAIHSLTFENASAGSISSVKSFVTLAAGPASQLDVAQQPAGQSGQQLSAQPVVHIKDAQGNLVTSDSSTQVKVSISGGGTLGGTVTKQASGGVVTFTDLTVTGSTSATHTLTFENASAGSISSVTSNVTLTAGSASQLAVATPPAGGQSGAALSAQPVVHIKDAQGNLVTSDNSTQVQVAVFGTGGTLGGTLKKQASGGVVTFDNLTLAGQVGTDYTLNFANASAGLIFPVTYGPVTVTAGPASQLDVAQQPAGQSGQQLSAQPVVHIKDAQGNLVTSDSSTQVKVSISGGGTLGGTVTKQASGGVVTFTDLTVTGSTSATHTLTFENASAGSISSVTSNVTLTAGPASQLDVAQQPAGQSGQQLSAQPVVHIKDAQGNLVTSDSSTQVKVSISGGGTLGGTVTKQASGGVVTFTDLTVTGSTSATHTLTFENASAGSISSVTSNVTLTAGPASQLDVAQQPAGQSGQQLSAQPVVHIKDAQGNLVTSDSSTQVKVSISGGGTLGGTVTKQASGGVVTFTDLTVTGSTSATHTLTFENASAGSISSVTSNVTLTAGPASQLDVAQQPAGQSGQQLSAQPVVHIKDAQGNLVTSDSSTQVKVSISGGGTLGGTVTKQASGGVVTFTDLTVTGSTSATHTLTFENASAGSISSVTSNVTLTAGPASQLDVAQQPAGQSGQQLSAQPVVHIKDAQGNLVTSDSSTQVKVSISGGGTLGGTVTKQASGGVVTFTDLTVTGSTSATHTLTFENASAGSISSVTSNVTLTAGSASQLAVATPPAGGQSGAALSAQPVVHIKDAQGNLVTSDNSTQVQVAVFGTGGTLGGTLKKQASGGVVTFDNLTLAGQVGTDYTLNFANASAGLIFPVTYGPVTVTAGPASQLDVAQQPAGQSGQQLSAQPVVHIKDAQGNLVTSDSSTQVKVSISGGGTLGGTVTKQASGGVVTFTDLTVTGSTSATHTLTFENASAGSISSVTSNVTLTAGPASQLDVAQQPAGQSGQQLSAQPVVHIKDAQGNLVTSDSSTQVKVSISGGGTLGGTVTKQASGGVVTFTDLTVTGSTSATHTLTFENASAGSISSVTSNVTLTAGPASQLDVAQQPAGQSGQQLSAQPVVHIKDAQGNLVTSDSSTQVKVSISGGGTLGGTVTKQASGGVVTFTDLTVTGSTSATHTLTFENASAGSISSVTSNVTLTAGPASQLDVAQQPAGQSGQQLSAQPVVHIKDAQGNLVTSDSSTQVKVSISGGGTLGGTVTKQASGGVVTFTDLTVTGSTSATHTLTFENASAGSISSVTSNVTLTAGSASQLAVATPPAGGQSGAALSAQPVVHIKDAQGNLVTSDNSTQVQVAVFGTGGTLGGTLKKQASGGVVTFDNLTLAGQVGTDYTLNFANASAGLIFPVTYGPVTVTAGPASQLDVAQQPAGQSGQQLSAQPVVHIKDAQGNLVTSDSSTQVKVSISGGGTLGGTVTKQASGGVVTFTDLTVTGSTSATHTLTFENASAGSISSVTSNVTLTAGPASQLDVAQQPAGQSGQQLSAQPVVHIKDAQGNLVTSDSSTQVKVSISGGGTLGGTVTKQASGGVVTFTDLTVTGSTSATHTLTFENASAGSISSVTSNVTLTAGPASQLDVAQQPAGQSGQQLSAQPVVHIKDAQGNLVTSDNSTQVQVSISPGGTLGGTLTKQASGGIVTFTDLTVTGSTSATHTLTFENASAGSISSVTSNVTLTAGPASQLDVAQQPAGQSGQQLSAQPVVHIKDAQGNLVTSDSSTQVKVSISGGGTLGGTVTKQASGGVVTFTDLTVTGSTSATHTLTFENASAGSISSVTSNVTLTAGPASQLDVAQQPAGQSGQQLSAQPVVHIKDAQGNLVTSDSSTQVKVSISGGGTLGGTVTKQASGGVVTFTDLTVTGSTSATHTLTFENASAGSISSVTSNVTLTAGPASQLDVAQQPAGQSGQQLSAQPVVHIKDAQGNLVTSDSSTQVKVSISGGGTLGGTVTKQASGGIVTFTDLTVTGSTSATHTLTFENASAGSISSVTSNVTLTATAGPVHIPSSPNEAGTGLSFSGNTVSVDSGTTVTVTLRDRNGNAIGNDGTGPTRVTGLTFAITQGPAKAVLSANPSGTSVLSPANGSGVFTANLNSSAPGNVVISATIHFAGQPSVVLPSTASFRFHSSTLVQSLTVRTQPVGAGDAQPLAVQPVVELRDGSGNIVQSDNSTEVRAILRPLTSGSSASLNMSCRPATNKCRFDAGSVVARAVNGVVTFDRIVVDGALGEAYVLEFTEVTVSPNNPVFRAVTSDPFSLTGALAVVRNDLSNILYEDLRETVEEQKDRFNDMAAGALARLRAGEDVPHCGNLESPDIDGAVDANPAGIRTNGTWGGQLFDCTSNTHIITDGSFALRYTAAHELEFNLDHTRQEERFLSSADLRGWFVGGYLQRNAITGKATGAIDGVGMNAGIYGALRFQDSLYLDYYSSIAAGLHSFSLTFPQAGNTSIVTDGQYQYAAVLGGAALSGEYEFETFTLAPRIGFEGAYAWSSDATVQLYGGLETGSVDIPDYRGQRLFIEPTFRWDQTYLEGVVNDITLTTEVTPSLSCRHYGQGQGNRCGWGLEFAVTRQDDATTGSIMALKGHYSSSYPNDRWTLGLKMSQPLWRDLAQSEFSATIDNNHAIGLGAQLGMEW